MNSIIKNRRKELGLSQGDVAKKVAALAGKTFSQQAYAKAEKEGGTSNSRFMAHICSVLDLKISEVYPELIGSLDDDEQELIARINEKPKSTRLAILKSVMEGLEDD